MSNVVPFDAALTERDDLEDSIRLLCQAVADGVSRRDAKPGAVVADARELMVAVEKWVAQC